MEVIVRKIALFVGIFLAEAAVVALLYFLATKLPVLYTIIVFLVVGISIVWWSIHQSKEKRKIYDQETIAKQRKQAFRLTLSIVGGLLLIIFVAFLIKTLFA
jgi:F0F1-type ATP synthase assembly protein I